MKNPNPLIETLLACCTYGVTCQIVEQIAESIDTLTPQAKKQANEILAQIAKGTYYAKAIGGESIPYPTLK